MNTEILEPLGSNCEFGFVLRYFGNVRPAVFRWTSINLAGLCELLDKDFADCFERANIRPHTSDMVKESRYDWAFHSALKSDGEGNYVIPEKRLARLYEIERDRLKHDIATFRSRLRNGNLVCIYSADGVDDEQVVLLRDTVDRFACNATNRVVVVGAPRAEVDELGSLRELAPRALRGTVSALAHYAQADQFDSANWAMILGQLG